MMDRKNLADAIFAISPDVRYVALYFDANLDLYTKPGLMAASSSESDRYEELLVNPTLLKLVTQRGNIDCGGVEYVAIRYGNFYQLVLPLASGHLSVAIEPGGEPIKLAASILNLAKERFPEASPY